MTDFKYKLIKIIDVSGFTFLIPVVRLIDKEEPQKQLKEIGRFIVIPVTAFLLFLGAWAYLAPKHKTKSGEVPTPVVVWDAASRIWTFSVREEDKESAYSATGEAREQRLASAKTRLEELGPLEELAVKQVAKAQKKREVTVAENVAPIKEKYAKLETEINTARKQRESELKALATTLKKLDIPAKESFLKSVREHDELVETEDKQLKLIKDNEKEIRQAKNPELENAVRAQTVIAEERQYLGKLVEQLSGNNRNLKVAEAEKLLNKNKRAFVAAGDGDEVYALATQIVRGEERLTKIAESKYAKPWTFLLQVYRSVACVFVGFLIGTVIAIPIGILCGLNKTFMAAMTMFIALFKPVSPIVWLPIALIIVGGFIEDPDKHWLIQGLASAPLIGWLEINPAFLASAITVALCSLWATIANTALGVASIDKDHLNVARVLRLGFWSRLTKIVIPSALPLIFAGLRISLGVGWMVLIAAELLSSSEGIGKFIWDQFNNGASDSFAKMMVVVFVVGVIGFLLDRIMIIFQRMVSFDGSVATI